MVIGVLGVTGNVGREVVAELTRRGHEVAVLSRSLPAQGEHPRVDVVSGEGLPGAMTGLEAVVDVLNGSAPVLVDGLGRALAAARAQGAGHVVSLSILGADRVPIGYYRTRVAQEAAVQAGGVPWSIVRATQFHSLLGAVFAASARRGVLPALRVPIQPVDAGEVAVVLADRVDAGPDLAVHEFAGPRVERLDRLGRAWAQARGVRRLALPIPALGGGLRAIRGGALTDPAAPHGQLSFDGWLRTAAAA